MNAPTPTLTFRIRRDLLAHYDARARDLPWRATDDPYRIWVSEIMLQQTRVETVIPYYERWMERFPELETLADAELDEVFQLWKGLGYYARARNLHKGARQVREAHAGALPSSVEGLRTLPGVGEYTAGAIASIAYGIAAAAVDGNVRRVFSRLFDLADPTAAELRVLGAELVDPSRPGDFNQALMELGATVCMPRTPSCRACPVAGDCRALAAGTVDERPPPAKRAKVRTVEIGVAVLIAGDGRILLRRRPDTGLLAGLWEFPGTEMRPGDNPLEAALEAASHAMGGAPPRLLSLAGGEAGGQEALPSFEHLFSHIRATYHPVVLRLDPDFEAPSFPDEIGGDGADRAERGERTRWIAVAELDSIPLPKAQQRTGAYLVSFLRRGCSPGSPSAGPRASRARILPRHSG